FFFFFFQAEDGIRDLTVTGVQTCALPISRSRCGRSPPAARRRRATAFPSRSIPPAGTETCAPWAHYGAHGRFRGTLRVGDSRRRSEERRVGKECGEWGVRANEERKI